MVVTFGCTASRVVHDTRIDVPYLRVKKNEERDHKILRVGEMIDGLN
jgi:hypothetical protein